MVIDKLSAKIKPLLFFSKFSQGWCPFFFKGLFVDCENDILNFHISLRDAIFFFRVSVILLWNSEILTICNINKARIFLLVDLQTLLL